jgi:hypothetical protein
LTIGGNEAVGTVITVIATIGSKTAKASVTVKASGEPEPDPTYRLSPASASLLKGESRTFKVQVQEQSEETWTDVPANSVTWSIEGNQSVGTVIANGVLTIGANEDEGSGITVTARYADKTFTAEVTVLETPTPGNPTYKIDPASASLLKGGSQTFKVQVKEQSEETWTDVPANSVTWSVEGRQSVGTVIANGVLTIGSNEIDGTVITVTATIGSKTVTAPVTVIVNQPTEPETPTTPPDNPNARLSPGDASISKNGSRTFTFQSKVTGPWQDVPANYVTWSIEGKKSKWTLINNGVLTIGPDEADGLGITVIATFVEVNAKATVKVKTSGETVTTGAFSNGTNVGGSVIDLIANGKDNTDSLTIDLTGSGAEPVAVNEADRDFGAGLVLTAAGEDPTSPAKVTIRGSGKTIQLMANGSSGSVITVEAGVTLTLKNITFTGNGNNTSPLIKVENGGKLILEDGAVIKDNKGAGVSINGSGSVVEMFDGARIEKNGQSGVYATSGGSFTMNGGTVSNNTNTSDGGGVNIVFGGFFTMKGGTISGNTSISEGGGVAVIQGTFNKEGGIIYGNTEGAPNANIVTSGRSSHAVFYDYGSVTKRRAKTAGANDRLSGNGNSVSGWD